MFQKNSLSSLISLLILNLNTKNNEIRESGEMGDIFQKNSLSSLISLLVPNWNIKNNETSEICEGEHILPF